jgi:fucose permease
VPGWGWWVAIAVIGGVGAGAIDSGLNTFMASHYGDHVMQWLHASFGLGVTLGPLIMTFALARLNNWRLGYQWSGIGQLLLALAFLLTVAMWNEDTPQSTDGEKKLHEYDTPIRQTLSLPATWMGMGLFFLYVGTEVSYGTWTYSILTESRGVDVASAGLWAGSYWATFTVGRVLAGFLTRWMGGGNLLTGGLVLGMLGAILLWLNPFPAASIVAVALVGFAIAPIFPALMSNTAERVGQKHAANVIGLQIAATGVGGATLSGLAGILAAKTSLSLEIIPILLVGQFVALLALHLASRPKAPALVG